MDLSNKAMKINPSITLEITAKAKELKESGVDVVSFGAGEPDFNTPENIIEAAIKAMKDGKTKYTPTSGILDLRKSICNKFKKDNELNYDTDQIVVSTGAKQSLANTFLAILNEGDEVIIPTPYWVSYPELVKLAGGVPVFINTNKENDYKYSVKELRNLITSKTKAILVNSPNNPTGSIYTKEELTEIAELAKEYDLIIISDEIYEKLIYDNEKHISIASISKDSYERTIVINGLSKAYAMTGWRIGYSASSKEIAKLMSSVQSHVTSNINSISQYAAIEALNGPQDSIKIMIKEFEKRRNYMIDRINKIHGLSIIRPKGAFYIMVCIENYFGKEINGEIINSSLDFSKSLLNEENVAVIPGIAFGLDNYIRLSYATSMEIIEEGLNRLEKYLRKLV
ncbi:MAG: pyridoxal phosphate-dependent aminotransferase [Clostridium sp.]|uniref:pyridoxal phosphate-dependent aminotransferase n=1 Tax=Clostridium sp. TaxID=1506 RepID=UPI001EBFF02A|nr:pyridoxal phosphate-dependent aminotransferase [Clostridium sp.]MBS5885205.1 pyridoxal phosphate-dependent aminotransferase [Clostridium sp.]MDU7149058.1 pyridoxal phosphate-dependent aminotransferase [Clostridium sp.]MDU7243099.1 pyridoxal phosphate-dependent aminotransferase [Clostridium sp.]